MISSLAIVDPWDYKFYKKGKNEKIVNVCFLVIPYRSVYNCILVRSLLAMLDVMAFTFQLKMRYYNDSGEPIASSDNIC